MQDLIDKIYGVEKDNDIDDLMRHDHKEPKKKEGAGGGLESGNTSQAEEDDFITAQINLLERQLEGFKFEEQKEKEIGKQIFLMTPEKLQKQKLQEFMQQYNFYINRLLIAKSDPFIE